MDPNEEIRGTISDAFAAFDVTGSAYGVVGAFKGRPFPHRAYGGVFLARSREGVLHLPGGRLEPREVPQAALARELREELGITSHLAERIGRIRFRHLTPKPHDYPYPFPVFEQVVYLVTAPSFDASHQIEDDWIADVIRMPMSQLEEADLPPTHRVFIDWLAMRQTSSIAPAVESVEPIKE